MPALPVLLFLVFLVLKLTDVIAWGWLWVTSPLWISGALGLVIFLVALVVTIGTAGKAMSRSFHQF
ncbi:hypothetical protein RHODO2019_11010 [Rhodococcus antarcticus]|uniref:Transmembrane Fragile-X-F protein n=1 Tax=Rhodococcus antarcticus TaxID=2987751 RepID=A0ABY6NWJ5_9NOCA|nr:hypothetical protein [Rhodococcus antarcticus]UZJ23735.1 hypothetical protein RHODO2019_11010 [Rhodococcus antarcticus]